MSRCLPPTCGDWEQGQPPSRGEEQTLIALVTREAKGRGALPNSQFSPADG
jgi:hypothetical protein